MRFSVVYKMVLVFVGALILVGCGVFDDKPSTEHLAHASGWDGLDEAFDHPDAVLLVYNPQTVDEDLVAVFEMIVNGFDSSEVSVALLKETNVAENAWPAFRHNQLPMAIVFHDFTVHEVFEEFDDLKAWAHDVDSGEYMMPTTRDYDEVEHIDHFDELSAFLHTTYVYVYSVTCPACLRIRNDIIALAVDVAKSHTVLFADVARAGGQPPNSVTGVPALLIYDENGDYVETIIGTQVLDYLRDTLE